MTTTYHQFVHYYLTKLLSNLNYLCQISHSPFYIYFIAVFFLYLIEHRTDVPKSCLFESFLDGISIIFWTINKQCLTFGCRHCCCRSSRFNSTLYSFSSNFFVDKTSFEERQKIQRDYQNEQVLIVTGKMARESIDWRNNLYTTEYIDRSRGRKSWLEVGWEWNIQ